MTHELRRADREITDPAEIDRILSAAKYATIALADGAQPYVVTLSCGFDAGRQRLCFHVRRPVASSTSLPTTRWRVRRSSRTAVTSRVSALIRSGRLCCSAGSGA